MPDPVTAPAFCQLKDVLDKEGNILDLAENGNIDRQMLSATQDIKDTLALRFEQSILDKIPTPDHSTPALTASTVPVQLRLPCVYRTLEIIYREAARDDESPYWVKAEKYESLFNTWLDRIKTLNLDSDKDGTIDEDEEDRLIMKPRIART